MAMKDTIKNTIAGVVAVGISASAGQALAAGGDMEKCYGVVKAAKNDCGNDMHSCAGQAASDSHAQEWIYLPKGTCDKLVGGSTTPKEDS